jgi:hypothetical protein
MVLDFIGDGTCYAYGDGSTALYETVDDSNVLIYVRHQCVSHECDKEHAKCITHLISNDYRIADSARAVIVLNQCRLSLYRAIGAAVLPKLAR